MIALRVRAWRSADSSQPEFLYQSLPAGALSLMATLPSEGIPVSIPHGREPGFGFPIGKSLPAATERWVVVYARQPNRFYEAIEILFEGKRFGIEDFRKLASRRLASHAGRLRPIPGRHMYFAPTIELWSTILENHGYAVADPSRAQAEITPEMREIREGSLTSGVLARISLYTGDKLPAGMLPVFEAELTSSRDLAFGR
jgi:hypothetical protein